LLRSLPLDHHSEDIRNGFKEIDLVLGKRTPLRRVCSQDAVRAFASGDDYTHAAHDAMFVKQRRPTETRFSPKIFDDDRLVSEKSISSLGIFARSDGSVADESCLPTYA